MVNSESANEIVNVVFKVLVDGSKQDYIGEKISQLEHSLQAAASAQNASKFAEFALYCFSHLISAQTLRC